MTLSLRTATVAVFVAAAATSAVAETPDAARAGRRAGLVAELLDEGAGAEARAEAARLRAELPAEADAALAPSAPALAAAHEGLAERVALCEGSWSAADRADAERLARAAAAPATRGGVGGWLARRVVGFYRAFIGPAIGARCALEPSCSRYFVLASRKHGLLGVPMTADRFVREPVVSAPDRPWVRDAGGAWRHPDPVEDHDWWFASEGR